MSKLYTIPDAYLQQLLTLLQAGERGMVFMQQDYMPLMNHWRRQLRHKATGFKQLTIDLKGKDPFAIMEDLMMIEDRTIIHLLHAEELLNNEAQADDLMMWRETWDEKQLLTFLWLPNSSDLLAKFETQLPNWWASRLLSLSCQLKAEIEDYFEFVKACKTGVINQILTPNDFSLLTSIQYKHPNWETCIQKAWTAMAEQVNTLVKETPKATTNAISLLQTQTILQSALNTSFKASVLEQLANWESGITGVKNVALAKVLLPILVERAIWSESQKEYNTARNTYRTALKLVTRFYKPFKEMQVDLYLKLALLYEAEGKIDKATKEFERVVRTARKIFSDDVNALDGVYGEVIQFYRRQGNTDKAMHLVKKANLTDAEKAGLQSQLALIPILLTHDQADMALDMARNSCDLTAKSYHESDYLIKTICALNYAALLGEKEDFLAAAKAGQTAIKHVEKMGQANELSWLAMMLFGLVSERVGKPEIALKLYANLVKRANYRVIAYFLSAKCCEANERLEEAFKFYELCQVSQPKTNTVVALERVHLYLAQEKPELQQKGVELLEGLMVENPANGQVAMELAKVYHERKDYDKAFAFYLINYNENKTDPQLLQWMAEALSADGKQAEATHFYHRALELNPGKWELWEALGKAYIDLRQVSSAIKCFRKVVTAQPEHEDAWVCLGDSYYAAAEQQQAVLAYTKALEINEDNHIAWLNLGVSYYDAAKFDHAIYAFKKSIDLNANKYLSWFNLANAWFNIQNYHEAIYSYIQAIELETEDYKVWSNLGYTYKEIKEYDLAIMSYNKALSIDEGDHQVWNNLGNVLHIQQRYLDAVEAYKKALEIERNDVQVWNNLGNVYCDAERYEDALKIYQKALGINGDYYLAWANIGNIHYYQGDFRAAIRAFKKATSIYAEDYQIYDKLAAVYSETERYDIAIRYHQKAVKLAPQSAYSWGAYAYTLLCKKAYKEVIEISQRAIELYEDYLLVHHYQAMALLHLESPAKALEKYEELNGLLLEEEDILMVVEDLEGLVPVDDPLMVFFNEKLPSPSITEAEEAPVGE